MKITHLVVNGCSWTYCQGLPDLTVNGWPALLAKKLGVPLVNLAVPGSGNDTIHRRTYEYYFEDLPNNNKPLYVIGWTQPWRREAWCRKYYNKNLPQGYVSISFPDNKPKNFYEAALLDNWSEEDFLRRTMLCQLSLDSLFKAHTIPYVSSFFVDFNNSETDPVIEKYKNHFNFINNDTINPIYKLIQHCEKLPCGHEGQESMYITADYFYDQLTMKYGSFTPVTGSYVALKDFNKKDLSGTLYTSAWE
jgi:hypothetical protein